MIIIGIDWSRRKHEVVITHGDGTVIKRMTVDHALDGFEKISDEASRLEDDPSQVLVGIEHHRCALLSYLLSRHYTVYAVNTLSAKRARERLRPSGSKDDAFDALVLADVVRMDRCRMRPIAIRDELVEELGAWLRLRARVVKERTRKILMLDALLAEWSPAIRDLCSGFNRKWHCDFVERFPLQEDLRGASQKEIDEVVKANRLRKPSVKRIAAAREVRPIPIPRARMGAVRRETALLAASIRNDTRSIEEIEATLKSLIGKHPDHEIMNSLPVKGTVTTACLLVILGMDPDRIPHSNELSVMVGASPVTVSSGRSRRVKRRVACDKELLNVLCLFAFTSLRRSDWARDYYDSRRAAGKRHHSTLRCLARLWLRIVRRLVIDRVAYDDSLHQRNRLKHLRRAA